ncbi:MAG: hypothetical protein ABL879_13935 [Devosia sp.]
MPILIEFAIALLLVGTAVSYFTRGRVSGEKQQVTERRVEAYMETIRREGTNRELASMSDNELRDLLSSGAHNLRVMRDRRRYLLFGGVLVALVAAVMVGTEDGTRGFGIALLVGAMVFYGINEFLARQMVAPMLEKGIDVERLRVE